MTDPEILKIFPSTQIKPYDGMPVNAAIWEQAHGEHRQALRAHDRVFHGSGIITGLEVIANDPPDQFVFISPGVAVDPVGQVIVLPEPVAYDFGKTSEGPLFLVLGHGEREATGVEKEVIIIQDEFVIAARPTMPKRPVVELARLIITEPGNQVRNATNLEHPHGEELDLRFRKILSSSEKTFLKVAVCHLGNEVPAVVNGWEYLGKECARSSPYILIIDTQILISKELLSYDLVYLSGKGAFKLNSDQLDDLHALLDGGRMLIAEALDAAAEKSFGTAFEKLGLTLSPLEAPHPILTTPFLFTAPPAGPNGSQVQITGRLIFSTAGYCLAWGGAFPNGQASRADIRSAHEWGINILHSCALHMAG